MTIGMQIRLWLRQATRPQRQAAGLGALCVVMLLVATVAVVPDDDGPQRVSANNSDVLAQSGSAGIDGSTDTTAPGTVDSASGASSGAGASAGTTGARGAVAGGGAARTAAGAVALKASDRGITDKEIKIGFLVANAGGLSGAGFALDIREDTPQYANALAAYVNARGGVLGRTITAVPRKTDPINQSDQSAACQAMASDAKVFGVVDVGAISDTPYMKCIAQDNEMPYVHNTIWGTDWLAQSKGLEIGYPAAIDRVAKTWTRDLKAMGWLPQGAVVGIIGDKCAAASPVIDNSLVPAVKAAGASKVVVEKHDCDATSIASQPPTWVTVFQSQNVTHVFLAANFLSNAVFMNTAANQGYHPKYTVSDWWQDASDASAKNYPASQFNGAVAITSNGMILPQSGKAPWAGWEKCNQAAVDAKLPPLEFNARNQELFGMCDNFFLMVDALKSAGPNPTRWDWAASVQRLGEHPSLLFGPSKFATGKVSGSDTVFTAVWRTDCTCFKATTDARAAAA
jgi:ABC-type branched-subunit amino acid transport system substrate-binding protein